MKVVWFFMLSVFMLTVSCTDSKKSLLIEDQVYQDMFLEFAILNHMDRKLLENRTIEELVNSVYDHYNVTEEQFSYTHDYFESNLSEQLLRMEKILVRLREERETISEAAEIHERENRASADSLRQRLLN